MNDLEKSCEVRSNALDNFNHALEVWHDSHRSGLTFKDYVEGNAAIHVHYIFRNSNLASRDFCAVLELEKSTIPVHSDPSIVHGLRTDFDAIKNIDSGKEQSVLVEDVKIMKEHEGILVPTPSIIKRLQLLQDCQCRLPDPLLEFDLSAVKGGPVFQNGKVGGRSVTAQPVRIVLQDERPKEMIESGPSIVEAVADHEGPVNNRRRQGDLQSENKLPCLSVHFLDKGIGFSFSNEGVNRSLESVKVFLCPSDLCLESDGRLGNSFAPSSPEKQSP